MKSENWLSIALLLALCSNASLLLILIYNTSSSISNNKNDCNSQPHKEPLAASSHQNQGVIPQRYGDVVVTADKSEYKDVATTKLNSAQGHNLRMTVADDSQSPSENSGNNILKYQAGENTLLLNENLQPDTLSKKLAALLNNSKQWLVNLGAQFGGQSIETSSTVFNEGEATQEEHLESVKSLEMLTITKENPSLNMNVPNANSRKRRDAAATPREAYPYKISEIFTTFTDEELSNFTKPVAQLLVPALVQFEQTISNQAEEMHLLIVSHDLRMERLERAVLNLAEGQSVQKKRAPNGRRRGDQPPQLDLSAVLDTLITESGDNDNVAPMNDSQLGLFDNKTMEYEEESSGDDLDLNITMSITTPTTTHTTTTSTTTTTTTTTKAPPTQPIEVYDLLRDMASMQQKVLALENYNTMSDSELTRVRFEVTKMDDKVVEMERKHRNTKSLTIMHTYKITDLETRLSRTALVVEGTMDAYGRLNSRVESFKDRLSEFKRDVHSVAVQFHRQEQISNELRSMDSYKAHDIQELRKDMQEVESRINEMYSQVDQSVSLVREDIRAWLDRLCINNKLAC